MSGLAWLADNREGTEGPVPATVFPAQSRRARHLIADAASSVPRRGCGDYCGYRTHLCTGSRVCDHSGDRVPSAGRWDPCTQYP